MRSALRRVLRSAAALLAALLALALGAYLIACGTAWGRERVRRFALAQLQPVISGQLAIAEISRLGVGGIGLRGIAAFDPSGSRVLALQELELDWSPLGLLSGELELGRVGLRSGRIDFADLSARRGVLAAFSPTSSAPESPAGERPRRLRLAQLSLEGLAVSLELAGFGVVGAQNLTARASYRQAAERELELASLSAELQRDGQALGGIDSALGHYVSGGAPSTLRLAAHVGQTQLQLAGTAHLPGDPAFADAPLELSARLDQLDAAALGALGHAEWGAALPSPLNVQLEVAGSGGAPQGTFAFSSRAGVLRGEAALTAERVARVRVSTEELSLAELRPGLPAGPLQGTLLGEAELSASGGVPVTLLFSGGRYGAVALPEATARARWSGEQLRELSLELRGYEGKLTLAGEASLDGDVRADVALSLPRLDQLPRLPSTPLPASGALELRSAIQLRQGQIRASGVLGLRALRLEGASIGSMHSDFELQGDVLAPSVRATMQATALRAGALRADISRLRVEAQRTLDTFLVALAARGQLQGESFQLSVQRARIGPGAALDVRGVMARAFGQRVLLSGRYGAGGSSDLVLQAHGVDLAQLSAALGVEPALAGTAELRATAHGSWQAPVVALSVRGSELRVGDAPALALVAQAQLDAVRGHARIETRAADDSGREILLHAQADFSSGPGASWLQRLDSARVQADAALDHMDSQALSAWLARPLPFQGTGSLRLWLDGSWREPALQSELRAHVQQLTPGRDAELLLQANYASGKARAALIVTDTDGPWLDAQAHLEHPEANTQALLRDAARLLERAAWDTRLELYPRRLTALPLGRAAFRGASSVELTAQLSAAHAPGGAPEAELQLVLEQAESPPAGADCEGMESKLDLRAQLQGGHLQGRLAVLRRTQGVAEITARSELELGKLLASGGPPRISGLELDATLNDVELSTLPLLCNLVHGRISGSARLRGALAPSPELTLALRARRLSLDRRNFMDATLDASAESDRARLALVLQHGATSSRLSARVPLELRGGSISIPPQAPISAELKLDHLPLGVLVPPSGAVSRASGTLSGHIELGGTRDAPELEGVLVPEAVGFTATALAQPLSDIVGRIVIGKGSVDIERLSARDGDGTLQVSGHLALRSAAQGADASLSLVAKEFPLRQQGRVAGTLDASARVTAALDAQAAAVVVQLDEASLWLRGGDLRQGIDLDPHPDVIDPRVARSSHQAVLQDSALPLTLSFEAHDSIWVRREDFAVKLSAQLTASRNQGELRIRGPVTLRRGYLQLLGKVFELQDRSRLEFVGGAPPDPVLDIQAQARNRGQSQTVTVKITGRARAPVLEFLIDDQTVSAGEAAQALFTSGATTGTAASQVKSFVSGLSSGVLALSARSELGEMMPILLVEPGTETSASQVRAGFELDSLVPRVLAGIIRGVYVEGIFASGNGQQQQDTGGGVLLELYLPHDLVTSGQYGPGETWSVDLGWEP